MILTTIQKFDYEYIQFQGKLLKIFELIYFNGPKLYIDLTSFYILVWNNEFENKGDYIRNNRHGNFKIGYEYWFLIKPSKKVFMRYLLNKISLREVLDNSESLLCKRNYRSYNRLCVFSNLKNKIRKFALPKQAVKPLALAMGYKA